MKINWEFEEAIVLLDLYFKYKDYTKISDEELFTLRKYYLNRASILNINYDNKFRNLDGLKMQLGGIHYIVTEGREGLSNVSSLFYKAVELYKYNEREFYSKVRNFYEKYSDEKKYHQNTIIQNYNGISCAFIEQLNRLRKSSSASIDNTEVFDGFKEYMHIIRNVENDLKIKLREINASGKKTLILLCGSAGDGKSHLLSYLKNSDSEQLLNNYTVYNDATESNSPQKTAIETLSEVLLEFTDDNLEKPGNNAILAINLGVLNNFIESEYSTNFTKFKKYVIDSCILSSTISNKSEQENYGFQHVSFSDYHLFTLSSNGVYSEFIESLLGKVFDRNEKNPFFIKYCEQKDICPMGGKCPVKHNYEFLMIKKVQKYISNLLIETIIKDKVILTTREILNFIYDLIVPQNFSYAKMCDDSKKYKDNINLYLEDLTPSLLYESEDVSKLMTELVKYDPLLNRNEKTDDSTISYFVSEKSVDKIANVLNKTPYGRVLINDFSERYMTNKDLKMDIYKLYFRIEKILNETNQYENDELFKRYITDLYFFNINKKNKLEKLYTSVTKSIYKWSGTEFNFSTDSLICLNKYNNRNYLLFEKLSFKPDLTSYAKEKKIEELDVFSTFMNLKFKTINSSVELNIDFSLYCLISKLNKGYVATIDDKNNHADYIGFVEKIIKTGSIKNEIFILNNKDSFKLMKTDFGNYVFKRVE